MELRSRRKISNPPTDDSEQKSKNVSGEDDTDGSDGVYVASSDQSSDQDTEYNGPVDLDLTDEARSQIDLSDFKDGASNLDNHTKASVCSSKRRKIRQRKQKNHQSFHTGETSSEDNDENNSNQQNHEAELSIAADKKKKKRTVKGEKPTLMWHIWEAENERWIDEIMKEDLDLENQNEVNTEIVEPPPELTMPLLRYQKEWLAWALKQEDSETKGGILADEMGMGKTIQAIALVLAKQEITRNFELVRPLPQDLPWIRGTLVICPVVAVSQWAGEIDRFTLKGSSKVLVYHGVNREKNLKKLSEYDFVITTYSVIEAEYRKYMMPPKKRCPYCDHLFHEKKLSVHLRYFCGPHAVKTLKQSKQERKKSKYAPSTSKQQESGKDNTKRRSKQQKNDYDKGIDSSPGVEQNLARGKSVLHSVRWARIILDEAHYIKSRSSNTARAVLALASMYKWALSGTPLQNRVGELYSLVRFLQVVPYSYHLCKDCDCRILDRGTSADCSGCSHKPVRHFCWWNRYVATPIHMYGNKDTGKRAMMLLKHKVLKNIVLRRTKKGRAADLALPPRIVSLRRDSLDIKELDYYESLYNESQAQFNTYIEAGNLLNNYAHIFDLLTRLRQAVDHPYLVVYSRTSSLRSANIFNPDNGEQECGVCHDPAEDPVVTSCEHVFCKACLIDFSATSGRVSCPSCSKLLTVDLSTSADPGYQTTKTTIKGFRSSSILNRIRLENFQTSTKIEALREEIRFMIERDGSAKGIVFSQFTSFLDLINYALLKSGVNCVQLNGSMSLAQRDAAISKFTDDPECKIFLMSLKAGGVALNLTVASHIFLMDPWWNPAVERQAQDRIHRIGQYKPIRIVRFIIENTIEERILKLQEKKELVFEGTVGGSSEALAKLTEGDLRFLFC